GTKVHRTILDNCRKTIAVGSYISNVSCRVRDVRVVGVRQELNHAVTGEQSEVSRVTRYHDGRTDDIAGAICDERRHAIPIGGIWTLSCADLNTSQEHGENENKTINSYKTFHDDLLHIESNLGHLRPRTS